MGLFDGGELLLSNGATRQILVNWHTPYIRMPFRSSLSDSTELQALNAIKAIGATPLVIVHGAADSTVATDDPHLLGLVAQVFGSSTVYVEYGNEEDLAGVNTTTYTSSWNAIVPGLKAAHPTYKFIGPVNAFSEPSYIGYFVGHASPAPDFVSWHEYTCSPTDAVSTCMSRIGNWTEHANQMHAAEVAAAGHSFPFMITEWNMDAFNDSRYLDPTVIGPWTTQALQELNTLVGYGLVGAFQYCADSHGGGFELIIYCGLLTPQGAAFQAAIGGVVPPPPPPPPPPPSPTPSPSPAHSPSPAPTPAQHSPSPAPSPTAARSGNPSSGAAAAGATASPHATPSSHPTASNPPPKATSGPTAKASPAQAKHSPSPGAFALAANYAATLPPGDRAGLLFIVVGSVLASAGAGGWAFLSWMRFRLRG
jgi:hypothetical protein